MTVSCRDSDSIAKVPDAGAIRMVDGERVQIMHNGLRVIEGCYYGDWMTQIIRRLRGHHEPQEELVFDAVMRLLPDRASMIELGGFWSYYSLWFLSRGVDRRSLVVEPDPGNLAVGRRNAELNGLSPTFRQGCVGPDAIESLSFPTEASGVQSIPMFRASDLCRDFAPEGLDLLHCDTQGAETAMLEDCSELLRAGLIRFVVVSTHAEMISGDPLTHQRCLDTVERCGGQVIAEHDVHESFSGDGQIAAYFGREPLTIPKLDMSYNRYSTSLFRNPLYDLQEARLAADTVGTTE